MTDLIADRWLLDRPNSYIGRSVPRPNAPRLAEGRGSFVDDISLNRTAHAAFVRSPHDPRPHAVDRRRSGQGGAGGDRGRDRPGARRDPRSLGRRAHPPRGAEVRAAVCAAPGHRDLAGRGGGRGRRRDPRAGGGRGGAGGHRLGGASSGHRCADRARSRHARDPRESRRQPRLAAKRGLRRRRRGLRAGRPRHRGDVRLRPAYRRVPRAPRHPCAVESGRRAVDGVAQHAVPAHDPDHPRDALSAGRAPGAGDRGRRRRIVRYQGAHLCRRDGDGRARHAPQAARQVPSPTAWRASSPTFTRATTG